MDLTGPVCCEDEEIEYEEEPATKCASTQTDIWKIKGSKNNLFGMSKELAVMEIRFC